jgi:D-aminopeptidase
VPIALGRVGSRSGNTSGDISIAFSTAERIDATLKPTLRVSDAVAGRELDELFSATILATEEAILNSIFASETMIGRDDNMSPGLPVEEVVEIMKAYARI